MKIENFFKKSGPFAGTKSKEKLMFNESDDYLTADPNLDLANGCIVGDIVVDVAGDVVVDVVGDVSADVAGDVGTDTAADIAADAAGDGADASADIISDVAADVVADVSTEPGITGAEKAELKVLAMTLGGAVVSYVVGEVNKAITNAINSGGGDPATTTSAQYWEALYNQMIISYPCDNSEFNPCPSGVRDSQELMVGTYGVDLGLQYPDEAQAASTFEASWTPQSQQELKNSLTSIAATAGIPSMIQYMETYTNPGATGAALVIATSGTVVSVASYCYSD